MDSLIRRLCSASLRVIVRQNRRFHFVLWWAKVDSQFIAIMLRFASRNRSAKLSLPLCPLVGQSGLEPPTSRLSVVCSSQLSYWPVLWILAVCFRFQLIPLWWRLAGSLFCGKATAVTTCHRHVVKSRLSIPLAQHLFDSSRFSAFLR